MLMATVRLNTTMGAITLELDEAKAPITVKNFLDYVNSDFYAGTIFHRVINGFMIQGGGLTADMTDKPTNAPIKNEADNGLKNKRGSVAMARTPDPHSASSQFFINVNDNDFLDFKAQTPQGWGYCVFGEVTEGMDVIDKIKGVATTNRGGHQDVPADVITIESVEEL